MSSIQYYSKAFSLAQEQITLLHPQLLILPQAGLGLNTVLNLNIIKYIHFDDSGPDRITVEPLMSHGLF